MFCIKSFFLGTSEPANWCYAFNYSAKPMHGTPEGIVVIDLILEGLHGKGNEYSW